MPALSHSDYSSDNKLLRRYAEGGDLDVRRQLVERFLPFAHDLARRYAHSDESLEDLVQVASIGLLKAIDGYDPERGTKFTSYAAPTIIGELKRYFRDSGWSLRVPRNLKERALAAKRAVDTVSVELGRSPTTAETAAQLGCAPEDVLEALEAASCYRVVSLHAPTEQDSAGGAELADLLGSEDGAYALVDELDAIARGLHELPELERNVVRLRFFEDLTQQAIGERLGYSQMHVSRLVRRAVARLEAATTGERRAA